MTDKAKVGMIGLRGYGNMLRVGLKKCPTLELAAIWSRDPESVERSQKELPSKACDSYEALLQEDIDGVIIVNPNFVHVEYGLKAAAAGKSILIEKPMTNTVAESKELIAAFKKNNVLLAVKHPHRFEHQSLKIKELIDSGELGKIASMETYTSHSSSKSFPETRWKRDPKKCPAAPLTQLGVHSIDTAMSFFGEPQWVESHHRNILKLSDNVDCTVTTVGFKDVVVTTHAHYVVPSYSRLAVYGTEGVVFWDHTGLWLKHEGEKEFTKLEIAEGNGLLGSLTAYGDALVNGVPFSPSGDEAIHIVGVAEAAVKSTENNGARSEMKDSLA
ncbi:MAG: Gfo/Idh/MocA family oxidoreductase [Kiritimatiellae bacterium]|nr:Gfo/Idh/MocA family oxidoreductase [Kiritimatiellia bacterium]